MSEHPTSDPQDRARTGVPAVDAVLDDVDGAADLPIDDHIAVFERAHGRLRRALDADPDAPADVDDGSGTPDASA